jgi:hypothetical protein
MEGVFGEMDVNDLKPRPIFEPVKEVELASRPHFKGGFTAQNRATRFMRHIFPSGFSTHRVRLTPGANCRATAAFYS